MAKSPEPMAPGFLRVTKKPPTVKMQNMPRVFEESLLPREKVAKTFGF